MPIPLVYSYAPEKLLESFRKLKSKEEKELAAIKTADDNEENNKNEDKRRYSPSSPSSSSSAFVVAAVQLTAGGLSDNDLEGFMNRAEEAVRIAVEEKNADLVLLPELFIGPYFCQSQEGCLMNLAMEIKDNDSSGGSGFNFLIEKMRILAKHHRVVLPISLFERKRNALFNSVVMIDADGCVSPDIYRKSHIPDGTGYQEKFYFSPGDTGFKVWSTRVGRVGVAICWDQWFPEAARIMALKGADVILYPTAIGTEPQDPTLNSADHWQRVMQGHSAANMVPVVASNRYGTEILLNEDGTERQRITFYGRSFITDETGAKVAEAAMDDNENNKSMNPISIITSTIDSEANRSTRLAWGMFRDRRPDLYGTLLTKDGGV
jgi:N-carbamoylputrescine amidase